MSKKIFTLITLVVLTALATGCERPGLTETAVPDGWLLRLLWPSAVAAPAAEGWVKTGWLGEALAVRIVPILVGLLTLAVVFAILFAANMWLTRGGIAKKPRG